MIATLRQGWIVTLRDLKHWVREPWTPIFGIAFSVMLLLVFGYLFGGAIERARRRRLPGVPAARHVRAVDAVRRRDHDDRDRRRTPSAGITDRFRSMPISSVAVPLGRAGADLAQLRGPAAGADGRRAARRLADRRRRSGGALLAVALLLWLRFAVLWIGIYLGVVLRGEGAQMAVQVLVWPLGFLSNLFVAPETMPDWLGFLAQWNPVSATAAPPASCSATRPASPTASSPTTRSWSRSAGRSC